MEIENLVRKSMKDLANMSNDNHNSEYDAQEEETEDEDDNQLQFTNSNLSPTANHSKGIYPDISQVSKSCTFKYESSITVRQRNSEVKTKSPSKCEIDNEKEIPKNTCWSYIIAIVVVLMMILVLVNRNLFPSHHVLIHEPFPRTDIIIKDLKYQFSNQSSLSFKILELAISSVLSFNHEPVRPAVLLLVSSYEERSVAHCFSKRLAFSINKTFVHIKGLELKQLEAPVVKLRISDDITQLFGDDGVNVMLLTNLEDLPPNSVEILHNYCDHENAPYKRSVFIMTVLSHGEIPSHLDSKSIDKYANDRLREAWKELPDDELESYLSRLSVSAMFISPDESSPKC